MISPLLNLMDEIIIKTIYKDIKRKKLYRKIKEKKSKHFYFIKTRK